MPIQAIDYIDEHVRRAMDGRTDVRPGGHATTPSNIVNVAYSVRSAAEFASNTNVDLLDLATLALHLRSGSPSCDRCFSVLSGLGPGWAEMLGVEHQRVAVKLTASELAFSVKRQSDVCDHPWIVLTVVSLCRPAVDTYILPSIHGRFFLARLYETTLLPVMHHFFIVDGLGILRH